MKKVFILGLLLTLSACAYVDPSLTDQTKVYTDAPVRKSSLQVSVHPKSKQYRPLTAYFHPFAIQQPNSDYEYLSTSFAQIFHNVWMEERLFPIMEFQPGTRYLGLTRALELARRRGADLLVLGMVPYFYAGNTLDETAITIQINVYSAGTGNLLWTMMQSGRIEDQFPEDYFYFRHDTRLPQGPFQKIIRSIARDMATPLKAWLPAPDAGYQFAQDARDVEANLTPTAPPPSSVEQMESNLPDETDAPEAQADRPQINGVNLNVEFDFDKSTIRAASYPLLDSVGEALSTPELKGKRIIIGGHTDAKGDEKYNLALSKKRAEAVKAYLVNKWGIPSDLIQTVGYGKSRPLTDGTTKEALQKNRRVEVRLAE